MSNDDADGKYPDLLPPDEMPPEFSKIDRLPTMEKNAPMISWGCVFEEWPDTRKIDYLKKLASTMNHAADVLQTERNEIIKIAKAQETQIAQVAETEQQNRNLLQQQMTKANADKEALNQRIVELVQQVKALKKEVKAFGGDD